jgi:hypothetical protein
VVAGTLAAAELDETNVGGPDAGAINVDPRDVEWWALTLAPPA